MNDKRNIILAVVLVIVLAIFSYSVIYVPNKNLSDEIKEETGSKKIVDPVATVNGEEISFFEFEAYKEAIIAQYGIDPNSLDAEGKKELQAQTVDGVIEQVLLKQAAENSEISISEEDIEGQFQATKGQFENEEQFQEALSGENMTEEELRSELKSSLYVQTYLEQELGLAFIEVTEEEVKSLYEEQLAMGGEIPPFEEVRDQLKQMLIQQKQQQKITEFVEKLKESSDIQVFI